MQNGGQDGSACFEALHVVQAGDSACGRALPGDPDDHCAVTTGGATGGVPDACGVLIMWHSMGYIHAGQERGLVPTCHCDWCLCADMCRYTGDDPGQALLRDLWLRHHDRRRAQAMAHRGAWSGVAKHEAFLSLARVYLVYLLIR